MLHDGLLSRVKHGTHKCVGVASTKGAREGNAKQAAYTWDKTGTWHRTSQTEQATNQQDKFSPPPTTKARKKGAEKSVLGVKKKKKKKKKKK